MNFQENNKINSTGSIRPELFLKTTSLKTLKNFLKKCGEVVWRSLVVLKLQAEGKAKKLQVFWWGQFWGQFSQKFSLRDSFCLVFFPNFSLALFIKMLLIKKHKNGCFRFYPRKRNCKLKNIECFLNNFFSMITLQTLKIVPSAQQRRLYVIMIKKLF